MEQQTVYECDVSAEVNRGGRGAERVRKVHCKENGAGGITSTKLCVYSNSFHGLLYVSAVVLLDKCSPVSEYTL